jgi:hypothetical protein
MSRFNVTQEDVATYGVPALLVAAVLVALHFVPDPFQLVLPVVAFAIGFVLRPRHVWIVWLASSLVFEILLAAAFIADYRPPKATDTGALTLGGFLLDTVLYAALNAVLTLLPLWFGRWAAHRRDGRTPVPS